MANRYWVGGTANWDGTAGTKWAATSNGPGGETVPTSADDVFFDPFSTGTVTIAIGNTGAKTINFTGFTGTLAGTAGITVSGNVTFASTMTATYTGTLTFNATATLISAGKFVGNLTINGAGAVVELGDAYNASARAIAVSSGTFNTNGFAITAASFTSSNSTTRSINLGASSITLSTSGTAWSFGTTTNLTFDAGTSTITLTGANVQFLGGGLTYYNLAFTNVTTSTRSIFGANVFNNVTLNGAATGLTQYAFDNNQTINGTLSCSGSSAIQRIFIRSNDLPTTRTLTVATFSGSDCDFRDITIAGAAAPISPTRAGDCGGNSGITFPSPKTVYRVGTNTTWQGSSSWATDTGGSGSNNNFPLAQDTAIINNDTTLSGNLNIGEANIGNLDCSTRTNSMTLVFAGFNVTFYGNVTLGSGTAVSGTTTYNFSGRSTMLFTSAGKTITFAAAINTANTSTFKLGDAFNSTSSISLSRGVFDADVYNVTATFFNAQQNVTRTISMGSGTWTLTADGATAATAPWNVGSTGGSFLTLNKGTANMILTSSTAFGRSWWGGGKSYNKLTLGGTGTAGTTIQDANNSFTELASTKTGAHTITLVANQGTIDKWSVTGTVGNVVTLNSSASGTRRTFTLTNISRNIDYMSVKDIGITNTNRFYVGANSTDGGNNLNVIFTAAPPEGGGNALMLF